MSDDNIIEKATKEQSELWAELDALRAENERLREQVYLADGILGSEPMIWLTVGSNHPEAQWAAIKPAVHAYWAKYGNAFLLRGQR